MRFSHLSRKIIGLIIPFLVVALAAGVVLPVKADSSSTEWKLVSQFGGSTQAVAVSGNLAYLGIGLRLQIVDVSDPTQPRLVGMSQPCADLLQDVVVIGKRVYAAAGSAGLLVLDITDPSQPALLGSWVSSGYAEGVTVVGKYAYLADGSLGLKVIDISNPELPVEVGTALSSNYISDVIVFGNTAYTAAGESGLITLNIKDPKSPQKIGQFDTDGNAYEVALSGKYVYIADAWNGIQVVDVSDPQKPFSAAKIETSGWSLGIAVSGKKLVSANGAMGSDIFDISGPENPKLLTNYYKEQNESDANMRRVFIANNYAYIADTLNGMRILDISHPSLSVTQKGLYSQLSYARRLSVKGDYAYLATAGEGALYVVNISDPMQPYQMSKLQADGIAADVVVTDNYATLGTFEDSSNCITVIDVSNPADPRETSAVDIQSLICGAPRQMAARDNLVYVADEWGLSIYDLSDPLAVKTIGRIQLDQSGHQTVALSLAGNYAYVAAAGNGLLIVDVSNPADPKLVQTIIKGNTVGSVISNGNYLYLGHYSDGISVMENSTPGSDPTLVGTFHSKSSVEEVTVSDRLMVSSEGSGGIEIIDASDPANLSLEKAISTPGFAWASVISDGYIYVADSAAGLLIYARGEKTSSSPAETIEYPVSVTNYFTKGVGTEGPTFPEGITKVTSTVTCMVTSSEDSGQGTLRACLSGAEAGETILFDPKVFSPGSPTSILLQSPLPELTAGSVTVDASNAGVILNGQQQVQSGLTISSSYNTIMGLQFINFTLDGMVIGFPSQYNQIGGDHYAGDAPSGQGNVFSGDTNGIRILFARNNTIKGNFFGTTADGSAPAAANSMGIAISSFATYNTVGGLTEGEKNIISNCDRGLDISSNSATNNVVAGNYVGTDVTGTKAIPNTSWGILIEVGGRYNIIGGTTPEERNIISGNIMGVCVSDYSSTQNSIIGNYIGLDVSGQKPLPNQDGVCVFQSTYTRVGGSSPEEANIISANKSNGVRFFGMGDVQAFLTGNTIGLDATGKQAVGNNTGLLIDGGNHSMIGGISSGTGNIFSNNNIAIRLENAGTSNNWIAGNRLLKSSQAEVMIGNNASKNTLVANTIDNTSFPAFLFIQSDFNRLSANIFNTGVQNSIELRNGANQGISAPMIDSASTDSVTGTAGPFSTIEIFTDAESSGYKLIGSTIADSNGKFTFSGEIKGIHAAAVATDTLGNSSVFSALAAVK